MDRYDYIIVGAGSAGCMLADRLTACGRHRVLLLEAGGSDRRFWIRVPVGYAKTFDDARVNWRYRAEADPGLDDRLAYWPRGRVLGGSSSINAMAYLRGLAQDFDDWAEAAPGWGWDDVRRTYDAIETHDEAGPPGRRNRRGSGPVWVSEGADRMHPFTRHFLTAAGQIGWPVSPDLNDPETPEGLTRLRSTVRGGRRWSAADACLRPALRRPNLKLATHAQVDKVKLDGRRARGVVYRRRGRRHEAHAAVEVIVCAGAVNSPQLLQLSGIGPAEVLRDQGVDVLHHLSQVGRGLQDHLGLSHMFAAAEPTLNGTLGTPMGRGLAGMRYAMGRRGPLGLPVNQISGFVRSRAGLEAPDLQVYCNPLAYRIDALGRARVDRTPGFLLCAQPCRPTSRGEVAIVSPDPGVAPAIRPNSLATEHDRQMAVAAGRTIAALAATPAIRAVTRGTAEVAEVSDADLLADFRAHASTVFHPTSTCRMGRDADGSVLDARLRVHGIGGLRVVDASAFPNITSGNTNAPVMMLAARAADMILDDAVRGTP